MLVGQRYDPKATVADEIEVVVQINGKVREKIMVSSSVTREQQQKLLLLMKKFKL